MHTYSTATVVLPSREDLTRSGTLHTTTRGCRLGRDRTLGTVKACWREGDTRVKDDGNLG